MPDTTFTILYILYKIGDASLVVGLPLVIAAVALFMSSVIPPTGVFSVNVSFCVGLVALLFLSIAAITPNRNDVKTYAVYTICETAASPKEAQELINTVIHYIEYKPAEK